MRIDTSPHSTGIACRCICICMHGIRAHHIHPKEPSSPFIFRKREVHQDGCRDALLAWRLRWTASLAGGGTLLRWAPHLPIEESLASSLVRLGRATWDRSSEVHETVSTFS